MDKLMDKLCREIIKQSWRDGAITAIEVLSKYKYIKPWKKRDANKVIYSLLFDKEKI